MTYRIDDAVMVIGEQSIGVLAQSIGGGGGYQTFNITRFGDTVMAGDNSSALVHQSIGAGGGVEQVSAGGAQSVE